MAESKIIGGVHALREALEQKTLLKLYVAQHKKSKNVLLLQEKAHSLNVPIEYVDIYQIDMMLPNMSHHQGVAGICEQSSAEQKNCWQEVIVGVEKPCLLILDSIQDPHNLGACLRSAVAAGVDAVLIPNHNAADITPVVSKVASGAAEIIPIFKVANLRREIEEMKARGIWVVGGVGEAEQSIYSLDLNCPLAIVVGNEGQGIRHGIRESCDYLASIPMSGKIESLNVSVACGIMLFEARRQRIA